MKYFIDFEATQFTNEIISIGCVREDGATFSSLVKPTHKVTKFITALTGITNEMLADAPEIDEVMSEFVKIFPLKCGDTFYSYGKGDAGFIAGTMRYTTDLSTLIALFSIKHCLVDYSEYVKRHFAISHAVPLKALAAYVREEEVIQRHDALEDAIMLADVFRGLQNIEPPLECPFPKPDPSVPSKRSKGVRRYKATHSNGKQIQYFSSIDDAVRKKMKNMTVAANTKTRIRSRIETALKTGSLYCNCLWEEIPLS